MHFGIGNIFRVFVDGIADRLLREGLTDRGITCVETFDFDVVDKIYAPYDNLALSVILNADGATFGFAQADLDNGPDRVTGAMGIVTAMLLSRYRAGKLPLALVIAGWLRYLLAVDDKGESYTLAPDPMASELTQQLRDVKVGSPETYVGQLKPILANANIWGVDLIAAGLWDRIEAIFRDELAGPGAVRETLKKYLD